MVAYINLWSLSAPGKLLRHHISLVFVIPLFVHTHKPVLSEVFVKDLKQCVCVWMVK